MCTYSALGGVLALLVLASGSEATSATGAGDGVLHAVGSNGCCTAHCCSGCGGQSAAAACAKAHAAGIGGQCCPAIAKMCPMDKNACTTGHCTWAAGKCAAPAPPPAPPPPPLPIVPPTPAPKCAPGSDPLQVFVMLGQSNMVGMGHIGSATDDKSNSLYHA